MLRVFFEKIKDNFLKTISIIRKPKFIDDCNITLLEKIAIIIIDLDSDSKRTLPEDYLVRRICEVIELLPKVRGIFLPYRIYDTYLGKYSFLLVEDLRESENLKIKYHSELKEYGMCHYSIKKPGYTFDIDPVVLDTIKSHLRKYE